MTRHRAEYPLLAAAIAVTLTACGGSGIAVSTTAPSSAPVINASIRESTTRPAPAFTGRLCMVPAVQPVPTFFIGTHTFDLFITASQPVNVSEITLELIDGSHVGPAVTFPQATLNAQFGSTQIVPGTRTFTLQPQFDCGTTAPTGIGANIMFVDDTGASHSMRITGPLN